MIQGLLLAAGAGRRLGGPKARLLLDGRTALHWCLQALHDGGLDAVRVVLRAEDAASAAEAQAACAEVVTAQDPARGQSASIQDALRHGPVPDEGYLLHLVDLPLLASEDVAALLAAFRKRPAGTVFTLPTVAGGRGHPVLFTPAMAAEFLALGPGEPAHQVLRRTPERVVEVPRENPWLRRDIDLPADAQAAEAELRRRAGFSR
ncbi:MAG: nucleotidyltransferase family protein [Planctomycetota bacterium]